jgi:hypothetical protein
MTLCWPLPRPGAHCEDCRTTLEKPHYRRNCWGVWSAESRPQALDSPPLLQTLPPLLWSWLEVAGSGSLLLDGCGQWLDLQGEVFGRQAHLHQVWVSLPKD